LIITAVVLGVYVTAGGAHADILTDGAQGALMLILGLVVFVMFLVGAGVDGGLPAVVDDLRAQDSNLVGVLNESTALYHSWWSILAILLAHIPLGLLPHIGNKLWALRGNDRMRFVKLAFGIGITMAMIGLGGLLARVVLGDDLLGPDGNPNQSLPLLFIELFPGWLAALVGVGILAAIMSTADGLVVSSTQIIANDIYRRTIVPWLRPDFSPAAVDYQALLISRVSTVVVLAICTGMAWMLMDINIALVVWIGTGGMMAAFAGPLVMGALWRGVTRIG
ncbi:MAG: sodium:pantothenate symporter, partial [Gammaproteobacteria bacterium]